MKKKIVSLCLVAALAATAVVGGTLAYFTDDDAKTNTFTMGNVDIQIKEWMDMDNDGNWEDYQDQELHPIAQSKAPFNKLVETFNDGSEDAYIRTFVTCPEELYWELGYGFNAGPDSGVNTNARGGNQYNVTWEDIGFIEIDGVEHAVFVCEYEGKVASNESVLSLTKVWVYDHVDNADIGESFQVHVYSEAIQAENLTYDEAMAELTGDGTLLEHAETLFN